MRDEVQESGSVCRIEVYPYAGKVQTQPWVREDCHLDHIEVEIGEQLLQHGLVLIVENIVKEFILIAYRLGILKDQKILKKENGKKNLILIK